MRQYRIPFRHFSECEQPIEVCKRVYEEHRLVMSRAELIKECIRLGVADRTAETQTDRWRRADRTAETQTDRWRRADRKIRFTALEKAQHVS